MKRSRQEKARAQQDRQQRKTSGRRYRKPGRGALWMLSLFLVGSAALRGAETYATTSTDEVVENAAVQKAPEIREVQAILASLKAREERVAAREIEVDTRNEALKLAERRLDEKLTELEQAEADLRSTIAMAESASENDLAQLTSVYENMGADEAAALFSKMAPDFAAGFLARMRPDLAAAIMTGLEPSIAYEVSVILAGRNAEVPTE